MKVMNMKKVMFAGVLAGTALYAFSFAPVPGSMGRLANVQAAATFTGSGEHQGMMYLNGHLYTGTALKDGKLYDYKNGVQGAAYSGTFTGTYLDAATGAQTAVSDVYYVDGTALTGFKGKKYYEDGVFQQVSGWKTVGDKKYYIRKGKKLKKGFRLVKSMTGEDKKYRYYFKKDGSVSTNLFKDWGYNKCIKSKMTIEINTKTHNANFYLYDKKTKEYIIPAKTVLCSTSAKANGTPRGHYYLMKTSAKRWVNVPNNTTRKYQWAVRIAGTPTLVHSSVYTEYGNNRSLHAGYYNTLGSSNTSYCVRMQAVNAKIIYDIATKTNQKERVWVDIIKKKQTGPFGVVKLKDTTGKLNTSRKTDPTDPELFPTNPY